MQKTIWIFGGIAGVLCALIEFWFYGGAESTTSQLRAMIISKMAILIVCVIFGLILIKKLLGGQVSLGRTVLSGILISLIRAVIMIIAFTVLYSPSGEFYKQYKDKAIALANETIANDEEIKTEDQGIRMQEAQTTISVQFEPWGYSKFALAASLITGTIISILMAAFIGTNMMFKE